MARPHWLRRPALPNATTMNWRPPQLAAFFISNQAPNVAYWHFASFAAPQNLGRYWTNSGQTSVRRLNRYAANDPKRTLSVRRRSRDKGQKPVRTRSAKQLSKSKIFT